jgi:hypothetical protein
LGSGWIVFVDSWRNWVSLTCFLRLHRSTPSFLSPALNSTSAPVVGTRKSSACTSVDGMVVKRRMVHSTT